tara:strand:+ start:97 stop:975 length:879 start_codon:yes stop_codon:yes gene_type:complete
MKKTLLIFIFLPFIGFAQDNIILRDGNEIGAKILEINVDNIKYKKHSNQDGPTYTKNINDIFMIKYQNGEKEIFDQIKSEKNTDGVEKYTLKGGDLIPLVFKQSISSKEMSNGMLVKFAVKEDILSDKNKIIIKSNTTVNGRITRVKKAAWAGQKGKIDIQINSVKAVDGTNIPVYYNLNNEGKSRQATAIGVGVILFWPALFVKGKQATIDAGTVIMVETMDDVTLNTFNFKEKEIVQPEFANEEPINEAPINEAPIQKKVIEKPKPSDFKSSSDYQKARREYYKSIEETE